MKYARRRDWVKTLCTLLLATLGMVLYSCGDKRQSAASATSGLEEAIAAWSQGHDDEAEAKFLAIQWKTEHWSNGHPLGMTERDFVQLPAAEQAEVRSRIIEKVDLLRDLSARILEKGRAAAAQGNVEEAKRYLLAVQECSHFLTKDSAALAVVKLLGESLAKAASRDLAQLPAHETR